MVYVNKNCCNVGVVLYVNQNWCGVSVCLAVTTLKIICSTYLFPHDGQLQEKMHYVINVSELIMILQA